MFSNSDVTKINKEKKRVNTHIKIYVMRYVAPTFRDYKAVKVIFKVLFKFMIFSVWYKTLAQIT